MKNIPTTGQKQLRDLVACGLSCLFFLHVFAVFVSSNGRVSSLNGVPGAAVSLAVQLCDGDTHDGKKTPAHRRHHHQHCVLCGVGSRDLALYAGASEATIIVLALPEPEAGLPRIPLGDASAPPPLGWISSWSSRAPPSFS